MIKKICANIDRNHIWNCTSKIIGREGENLCTQLELTLEECLCDSWVFLHFEKVDGTTKVTPKLEIIDNKVTYDIGNDLLDIDGDLKVIAELHNESGLVWKSSTKTYSVLDSFNGADQIENKEDFITEAQKTLEHLNSIEEGKSASVQIGEVETLEAGAGAYVENVGTETDVILNFGIPKGEDGTGGGSSEGTSDYERLENLPSINHIELKGNKTLEELGIQPKGNYLIEIPDNIATKEFVENEIATFDFIKVVEKLPETGLENRIYFVPKADTQTQDLFDEYVWINGAWEWVTTKQIEVDLTNYVKNTDYATANNVGLVKANGSSGISVNSAGGIGVVKATDTEIDAKSNSYKPIVPANLEYAVKSIVGGHITLTQAEYDALETKDENTYYYIKEEE